MAENAVVKDRLTDAMVEAGADLTRKLDEIGLLDQNAELVKLLRIAIHTGPGIGRIRFSKNVINGHFIEDALIYRVA